ncbi:palmitoyltransferase ZDHHC6 isoform X2 [Polistes fuscatus]|uniref:palmitoyltransferase ZDHHC6 isoform X2 n=1 Tax=Polistes fuscatus TaxID=30207 RepID=UPI001CA83F5C|nr:palmitoyltransferase ZDHHC6 isoform X2 [Polistes fuscatus]
MCIGPLKKICHWGPLTALGIIKIITLITIHCSRQWWPPQESFWATANFCFFFFFSGSTLFHFISAIFEGPGFLPLKWKPEKATDAQFLQYCTVCQGYKAPRSHHCRKCGLCVMKMDHHCPWINNCVGHHNHGHFTAFLASAVGGCFISTVILIAWMISIIKNKTEIEDWISEKAYHRRFGTDEKFIHPYSKGWLFNMRQVFTWDCSPVGDGINWPVIDGCDQYTLTKEQLAQKMDKRRRARRYRIIKPSSGSWLPIQHGWGVLCHPPYTDETRIKLDVTDIVIVTRWRRYWLFGEKEQKAIIDFPIKRVRGWFPRPCAIELIESNQYTLTSSKSD